MVKDFSPEEKLLNLIKRKKTPGNDEKKANTILPLPKEKLYYPKDKELIIPRLPSGLSSILKSETTKALNKILLIVLSIVLIYFFIVQFFACINNYKIFKR